MKKHIASIILLIMLGISTNIFSQDKVYKDGSVWSVSFIRSTTGMGDTYLANLKTTWKGIHDEAVKQGLILSYKILQGSRANPEDWDIMLLVEYKNLAAMENSDDKWDAIYKSKIGDENAMKKLRDDRVAVRTIYGEKLMREVVYK